MSLGLSSMLRVEWVFQVRIRERAPRVDRWIMACIDGVTFSVGQCDVTRTYDRSGDGEVAVWPTALV